MYSIIASLRIIAIMGLIMIDYSILQILVIYILGVGTMEILMFLLENMTMIMVLL
jgi:hypothetical protein